MVLNDVLLDSRDGLVLSKKRLWYHFNRYPWDLVEPGNNPSFGEHNRQITLRIKQGLPGTSGAYEMKGEYHLGIAPHIGSYYHLLTDLLPHLIQHPHLTVLIPAWLPAGFRKFLEECNFQLKILPSGTFRVERLWLPSMADSDWDPHKVNLIKKFIQEHFKKPKLKSIQLKLKRIYISRTKVGRRHLVNEDKLLPVLAAYGFRKVLLERISILDQISLFQYVTHLVAPHGAGLVNALFSYPETRILEIRPIISSGNYCFESLFACGWRSHEVLVPPQKSCFELVPGMLDRILNRWVLEDNFDKEKLFD